MPIHRYTCASCNREREQLELRDTAAPSCCGVAMDRAMPRRVVGRCMPDRDGAHAGSGFAGERVEVSDRGQTIHAPVSQREGLMPATTMPVPTWGDIDLGRVPAPSGGAFAKDFGECHAADRDARWRDTAEALTATTVPLLERNGVEPAAARSTASAEAQRIIERSRADQQRGGAPT